LPHVEDPIKYFARATYRVERLKDELYGKRRIRYVEKWVSTMSIKKKYKDDYDREK